MQRSDMVHLDVSGNVRHLYVRQTMTSEVH